MTTGQGNDAGPPTAARPSAADIVLAGVVAAVLIAVVAASQVGTGSSPSVMAYVFAVGFGAVLLLRRWLPVPVLVLSVLGTFAYYTLGFPPIGIALPVVAALYSAAETGRMWWSVGAGAVLVAVSLFFRVRDDDSLPVGYVLGTDAVLNVALIAAAIALGYGLRARRLRAAQQEQIARLTRDQASRESELRVQMERERISRELHDTVGHSLSVISLHANVGSEAVGRDDVAVAAALTRVREQSNSSLQELRSMVRLLRTDVTDETRHPRSLAEVQVVIDEAIAAGLRVVSEITVEAGDLSVVVDAAAYRVIQESLTNVLRHAHASTVRITAGVRADLLHISIADDGRGADPEGRIDGHGIGGMTERVRLLGGTLATCSDPATGFTVEATIPARLSS